MPLKNCPYRKPELLEALVKVEPLLNSDEEGFKKKFLRAMAPINQAMKTRAELNRRTAAHHGITPEQLVASPNMYAMIGDFEFVLCQKAVENVIAQGFSEVEAWAIVAVATGNLVA